MQFPNLNAKAVGLIILIVVGALVVEFLILEGTIGVSLPADRYSAASTLEMKVKALEKHFVTRNNRFTVVDFWTDHGSHREVLVLREYLFTDQQDSLEGPPKSTITVQGSIANKVRWTFHEPGHRGEVVTNNLYKVVKWGSGEHQMSTATSHWQMGGRFAPTHPLNCPKKSCWR